MTDNINGYHPVKSLRNKAALINYWVFLSSSCFSSPPPHLYFNWFLLKFYFYFFCPTFQRCCTNSAHRISGHWPSWALTVVLSCWNQAKKALLRSCSLCFFWCRSLSSVMFTSPGIMRRCFSYLSVLYGSSDLCSCCIVQLGIGERRKLWVSLSVLGSWVFGLLINFF